jgi:hypothetical protein
VGQGRVHKDADRYQLTFGNDPSARPNSPLTPRRITTLWRLCLTALVLPVESAGFEVKSSPCYYHVGRKTTRESHFHWIQNWVAAVLIGDMRLVENSDGSQKFTKISEIKS